MAKVSPVDHGPWNGLSDEQLLEKRISQLKLQLQDSHLQPLIEQLHRELAARNLTFHPPCHVGDEWFVPVGIPAIYIPFFLVHERLERLERRFLLEVEGDTPGAFMKLLRHEAGHAYAYAYQLYRKKRWQRMFGLTSFEETPAYYRPRPYSKAYVIHLDDWYAQSHPDEDFAETFAVWLTPDSDWQERYKDWKAFHKLQYVDELMKGLAGMNPTHAPAYKPSDYDFLNIKLKNYYLRKRKEQEETYPDFYDQDLRRLFPANPDDAGSVRAATWLRRHRRPLLNSICEWTKDRRYPVAKLLKRLIERCDDLNLALKSSEMDPSLHVSAYITTLVMNHLFTGKFKRTK